MTKTRVRERARLLLSWGLFPTVLAISVAAALAMLSRDFPIGWVVLGLPVSILVLVAVTERLLPYERAWQRDHGDRKADITSLAVLTGAFEPLLASLYPALAALIYLQLEATGLLQSQFPAHWPVLLQTVLLVLLADLLKYWFHRFGHETHIGWRIHSMHHSVKRVYWLNGFRIHPLYHLVNFLIAVFPWICLGATAEAVALYTVILAVSAAFQHANIDLRHGFLNYVFNTNEVHRWHHSRDLTESNANYGAVLLIWDLLFGSYRFRPGLPAELGMVDEARYPMNSYTRQLLVTFFWKSITGQK